MTRQQASQFLREKMNEHGLIDWSVRLNQNPESKFLGLCSYKDKCIILSAHHIDIHPDPDVKNTILHEIAHALVGPGHAHDGVWASKAREIGCDNTLPCSNLSLSPEIIDAIRSGADVEVTFDEQVIRTPKYTVTRLQDKCEVCGKVAKMLSEKTMVMPGDTQPDMKFITLECGHMICRKIPKGTPFHTFQMGGDPSCLHTWDKNHCVLCNRYKPYDFQIEGMKFLEAGLSVNKGAACFDEMGLGKTIQAGGVIYFHSELWPVLWVVKSALKYQTSTFILDWFGTDHVPQVVNTSKDWLIPGLKHYIIGYDMLVPKSRTLKSGKVVNSGFDITQFDRVGIKLVVLDECQQIKNVDSTRTQMVRRVVKNRKVLPLSGTPWNNRGSELYPVFNMMDPIKFNTAEGFERRWVDKYWHGNVLKEGGIRNIPAFKEYTKDLCIRRERTEVLPELPLINRTKLNVVMSPQDEANYDAAVDEFVTWYEEQASDLGGMAIIAAMAKMRHIVALAKIPATLEYVDEFIEETDRKICVFAHHKDVQELLYMELKEKYGKDKKDAHGNVIRAAIPVLQFVAGGDVNETQYKFNQAPRAILVASQLAAGEGLNLQTCCDCVMHERQWNPGKEEQAEGRFIRIGSTAQSVSAVYAHLEGITTTDPQLDAIVERKRIQFHALHNKGEATRWNEESIMKELAASIVSAHNAKKNRQIAKGA
jgi:hypothetical protein